MVVECKNVISYKKLENTIKQQYRSGKILENTMKQRFRSEISLAASSSPDNKIIIYLE